MRLIYMRSPCNLITIFLLSHFLKWIPFFNVNVEVEARRSLQKCEVKKADFLNSLQACLGKVNKLKVIDDGIQSKLYLEGQKKCVNKYIKRLNKINRRYPNCFQESPASDGITSTKNYFNLTDSDTINEQVSTVLMSLDSLYTMSGIQGTSQPVSMNHRVFIYPYKPSTPLPVAKNGVPGNYDVSIKNANNLLKNLPPSISAGKYPLPLINPFNPKYGGITITDGFIFEMTNKADMVSLLNAVHKAYNTMNLYLSYTGSSCQYNQTTLFTEIYNDPSLLSATKQKIGADVYVDDEFGTCTSQDAGTILSSIQSENRNAIFVLGHNPKKNYLSEWTNNNIGALMLYVGSDYSAQNGYPKSLAYNAETRFTKNWATNITSRIIYGTGGLSLKNSIPGPVKELYIGSAMDYVNRCPVNNQKNAGPEKGKNVNTCVFVPTDSSGNNLLKSLQSMNNVDWYIGF